MKRYLKMLVSALLSAAGAVSLFAQASYDELFKKAQQYETEKKWISAAATYYDAMAARPEEASADAYFRFNEITDAVYSGKPGLDTYDDFTLAEGWEALVKDAETYFTANPPFVITTVYEKGELDMASKTATYYVAPYAQFSEKGDTLINSIRSGIKKSKNIPVSKYWPAFSVFTGANTGDAAVTAITIPKSTKNTDEVRWNTIRTKVSSYSQGSDIPVVKFGATYYVPSWAMREYNIAVGKVQNSLYEIQLELVGNDGKVIGTSGKGRLCFVPDEYAMDNDIKKVPAVLKVSGVNSSGISAIDGRKFSVRVKSLVLKTDNLTARFVKEGDDVTISGTAMRSMGAYGMGDTTFKASTVSVYTEKHLKDIACTVKALTPFPTSVIVNSWTNTYTLNDKGVKNVEFPNLKKDERTYYTLLEKMENETHDLVRINKNVAAVRNAQYTVVKEGDNYFFKSVKTVEFDIYSNASKEYICNLASVKEGLEPAYSLKGESDPLKWKERNGKDAKYTVNTKATGYRYSSDSNYTPVVRTISDKDKDRLIAEFEAKAAAHQKKISDALAPLLNPLREKFLIEPKDYKAQFQPVNGTFNMEIPLWGTVERKLDINVSSIEVTQGLYEKIMGENPAIGAKDELYPVTNVSYYEALVFCNKLSEAAGLTPVYSIKKSTDTSKWGDIPSKASKDWDKVSIDKKATGFRLPSTEEIKAYTNAKTEFKLYYAGCEESSGTITVDGETIHKPQEAKKDSFSLYNTADGVYEMYYDKGGAGYIEGSEFVTLGNSGKSGTVGLRLISGK